ncbi:MAG: VCBS repeat-containing protein [Polyangiaceae bacterium]|nr:VCBS repeat-containing protein [Polyangiaceae bacterium]
MRYGPSIILRVLVSLLPLAAAACDGGETVDPQGGSAGSSTTGGSGGTTSSSTGDGGVIIGGSGGGSTTSTAKPDPCDGVDCAVDQHCEDVGGVGTCVNNTCDMLMCSATEACDVGPNGGSYCKDISCANDLECVPSQFCNGTICVDDVCNPGLAECLGDDVLVCLPNGSGTEVKFTCGSDAYFTSICAGDGMGSATCTCADDWDCPSYTTCDVVNCSGTGKAPTCSLPPVDFKNALPVNEIQWGGTGTAQKNAVGSPFPSSSQACGTPVVANLDDDNGDGLINERDFPEIIFMSYCASDVATNGIVRAIHGGGPNKGKDFFASCGATTWHEGDDINMACACANAEGNSTAAIAVGDLDNDGVPEIVVPSEQAGLIILDNKGTVITKSATAQWTGYVNPAPAIANLDNAGFAEIVVGRYAFTLEHDANGKLTFVDKFSGALMAGNQGQGPVPCIANITGDVRPEIIGGTTVYRLPVPPAGVTKIAECPMGATDNFCTAKLDVVWDGQTVNAGTATPIPNAQRDGFCAIADVLGMDETIAPSPANPLDGKAEVVLINEGHLLVLNGETGVVRRFTALGVGNNGGAPNIDDFDGDGFPEVGTAFGTRYVLIDLQDPSAACPAWPNAYNDAQMGLQGNPARNPGGTCTMDNECAAGAVCNKILGKCTCLYNAWQRVTEDDSSQVTSSSVFDFNGDGAAEVIYNDECFFRVYDGLSADVLFKHPSPSRTRIENPIVADVDNDGNAEIVFPSNNEAAACSSGINFPNGIAVWGDSSDSWVSARRIYNQHAYHVTNVTEGGQIPKEEPESWKVYNGRVYNTYRSNPRNYNVAPDLTVTGVQVSSPGVACGELSNLLTITTKIDNAGDLRVGPGVVVTFYGIWGMTTEPLYADGMMTPIQATIQSSLEPGDSILISVDYNAMFNTAGVLPDEIKVVVDEADIESECKEDNNSLTQKVEPSMPLADLRIQLGLANDIACPMPEVQTTLINDGAAEASNVLVRYYAGDPNAGGSFLHEQVVPGPIAPNGGMVAFTATIAAFPNNLSILIYGIVDPDDAIPECNDGNNKDSADNKIECGQIN